MIRLVAPDPARHDAWAACLSEFAGGAVDGSGYTAAQVPEPTGEEFAAYLRHRLGEEDPAVPLAPGRVPCANRWIVDETWDGGGPLLGFLAVRHTLNRFLFEQGGHIGYSVRPGARRRGVATAALAAGLETASSLGIDSVLVLCLEDNEASRRTIERVGGQYESSARGHRRYWFGTPPWPSGPDV